MSIAQEILNQLGGGRFAAMTGAKNFISSAAVRFADTLSFRLPGKPGFCKNGINCVQITLDASDTYTVKFSRIRGTKVTPIATVAGVYNDNLREVFENHTGLRTSL